MKIEPRSLPLVEELIKTTGLTMTYPYDDLVFVEHNPFLLRFNDSNINQIFLHFNKDCLLDDKKKILTAIKHKAHKLGVSVIEKGLYNMVQIENTEEIQLKFLS